MNLISSYDLNSQCATGRFSANTKKKKTSILQCNAPESTHAHEHTRFMNLKTVEVIIVYLNCQGFFSDFRRIQVLIIFHSISMCMASHEFKFVVNQKYNRDILKASDIFN